MNSESIYMYPKYEELKDKFKTDRIWRTDGKYEPFVYIIQEVETEKMYIGSKTQKGCLESWLGTKYFTSSKEFDWKSDPSSFEISYIIPCASNHDALVLEGLLIGEHNAVYSENYYNVHHPDIGWNVSGMKRSPETRKKMSESRIGKQSPRKGKSIPEEHKNKISESIKRNHPLGMSGKTQTEETRGKIGDANRGKKNGMYGKNPLKNAKKKTCPHCCREFYMTNYSRWHGDKCKHRSIN